MPTIYNRLKKTLPNFSGSFLARRLKANRRYGFLPYYLYFLDNFKRWAGTDEIEARLLRPVSRDRDVAWNEWKDFRGAQAEVTAIFLIEKYARGTVLKIEGSREGNRKKCDLVVQFSQHPPVFIEIKAQSGQQNGSRHPLSRRAYFFSAQAEEDLASWLFKEKLSATTGEPMVPRCKEAANKGADILFVMMDIIPLHTRDIVELGMHLAPDYQSVRRQTLPRIQGEQLKARKLTARFVESTIILVGEETTKKMWGLKEVWLVDSSCLQQLLILRASIPGESFPDLLAG